LIDNKRFYTQRPR